MTRRHATGRVTATMAPSDWPWVLFAADLAVITRRSPRTIANLCAAGAMDPAPATNKKGDYLRPLRWTRESVQRWAEGERRSTHAAR